MNDTLANDAAVIVARLRDEPDTDPARVPVLTAAVCDHLETICPACATQWQQDWDLDFGSTAAALTLLVQGPPPPDACCALPTTRP